MLFELYDHLGETGVVAAVLLACGLVFAVAALV